MKGLAAVPDVLNAAWFHAVVILIVTIIVARVIDALLARRDRTLTRLTGKGTGNAGRTRFYMIRRLAQAAIMFVGVAVALGQFEAIGTFARAMLASAAIVGAVIGIAARAPIANLVTGVMIAFAQPVRLGDYINVGEIFGTVEEITLSFTRIETLDHRHVVIPNEVFASTVVNNFTMGSAGSMVEVVFTVPITADLERVCASAHDVVDALAPPPEGISNSVDVHELAADHVTLRVFAWAPEALGRRRLASDVRMALQQRLVTDGLLGPAPPVAPSAAALPAASSAESPPADDGAD